MNKKKHSFGLFDVLTLLVLLAVIALPLIVKAALSDNTTYIEYKIKTEDAERLKSGDAVIIKNSCVGYILAAEDGTVTVGAYAEEKPDGYYVSGIPVHIGEDMTFFAGDKAASGVCVALARAVVPLTDGENN